MLVYDLEQALFNKMPRTWAEPWDKVGLMVGDPDSTIKKIALALDASATNVARAADLGANVLLTHHPVCLSMPDRIVPGRAGGFSSNCLWEAVKRDVSIVSFHTNLDRHPRAAAALANRLGFACVPGLEPDRPERLGRLGAWSDLEAPLAVESLATLCRERLGAVAQVYPGGTQATKVAFFTGSIGDGGLDAVACGCDAVVCGECGYHKALDMAWRGCTVVVLGHDVSELPLVGVLDDLLDEMGISRSLRVCLDERPAWLSI